MAKIVKRCDCDENDCGTSNRKFHVHVGNYCIHKFGRRHKLKIKIFTK